MLTAIVSVPALAREAARTEVLSFRMDFGLSLA